MEKLNYLINYLLKENEDIQINEIPNSKLEKKKLYRSLCNIREPREIDKEYIKIENEYLQEELKNKNVTRIGNIKTVEEIVPNCNVNHKNKICLWQGDITTLKIEAVVNAANFKGFSA